MKNLPIGIQTLTQIREKNCVYVDKTPLVYKLVSEGKCYFFSRPRRFGKSLLVSTLKELFEGNKGVFEGLWIENQWDWTKIHPVLHFSFDNMGYHKVGLEAALLYKLDQWAEHYQIIHQRNYAGKYQASGKVITAVGVNFNGQEKQIDDWLEVEV